MLRVLYAENYYKEILTVVLKKKMQKGINCIFIQILNIRIRVDASACTSRLQERDSKRTTFKGIAESSQEF